MNVSELSAESFLFNYYSFGSLLVLIVTFLLSVFFLSLKDKTTSTYHLGIGCLLLTFFQMGYFLAAFIYHPIASYHRWFTGGFILPAILHFGQFLIRWPNNENRKIANSLLFVQWILVAIAVSVFVYYTAISEKKYHFTAHHWDFNAEEPSKYLGIMIAIFSLVNFFIIPIYRTIVQLRGRNRWIMIAYILSFFLAAFIPNLFNVMSRDGVMERSTYLTSLVLLFYFAFFLITVIFINTSTEKTTFMIKIVGISFVTVMLIFEQLALIYNQEKESLFDRISLATIQKHIRANDFRNKDLSYVIESDSKLNGLRYLSYDPEILLDLSMIRVDMEFSRVYEEIIRLDIDNYRQNVTEILSKVPPYFNGYKLDILNFINQNSELSNSDLKENLESYFPKLNKIAFIATNKLGDIDPENFCLKARKYIESDSKLKFFKEALYKKFDNTCRWEGKEIAASELKVKVLKYFRYFKPAETRHYRKNLTNTTHYVAYMIYDSENKEIIEAGFPYLEYRKEINRSAIREMGLMFVALVILLIAFPFFFKLSLINPLNDLTSGVKEVNEGDLDVKVPVHVNDEIGFLADSFNKMVASIKDARRQLEDYAENLELKVQERTKEVQEKMEEIQRLKIQQDGDYFLTSLLAKPLFYNANKSELVRTDFFVHQKKQFEFRKKTGDLGGDICVTGNLKLGKPDNYRRYTVAMNGDAMGKSMQGAGGSLVMGVVMNSIMARSAGNKRILNRTPDEWLTDVYEEINSVFKSFNGTMVISATVFVVDDETGECWYFNAEHPFSVLYRDGKASFIETELQLRKLGLDSEIPFEVKKFQLLPGDTVIMGSDGRDDIDLTPDKEYRTINEDEEIFLKHVEEAKADIYEIEKILKKKGDITDDLSLLRLDFQHSRVSNVRVEESSTELSETVASSSSLKKIFDSEDAWEKKFTTEGAYEEGRNLYKNGDITSAIELMYKAYSSYKEDPRLNKLLSLLCFKSRDYKKAVEVLDVYLRQDPDAEEFWYYLSVAKKKLAEYDDAIEAGLKAFSIQPQNLKNCINLADLYRLSGNLEKSREFAEKAEKIDPENKNVKKLFQLLEKIP